MSPDREHNADSSEPRSEPNFGAQVTQICTISYLVLFSMVGTFARYGLQSHTVTYAGAPLIFPSAWPNFAGCVVMGFLIQDQGLFRRFSGPPDTRRMSRMNVNTVRAMAEHDDNAGEGDEEERALAHLTVKKRVPLYIGLTTGFCGSVTTFSAFIRDMFTAGVNLLESPNHSRVDSAMPDRPNGLYGVMALFAVLITTLALMQCGLELGAQIAHAAAPIVPTLPRPGVMRRVLDPLAIVTALACWATVIALAATTISSTTTALKTTERWPGSRRGPLLLALCFAPVGCLARYLLAVWLNGHARLGASTFPLGTFVANVSGTVLLAIAWDLQHLPVGGVLGCQLFQGVMDGLCGCLTTVSTFAAELQSMRRKGAYLYAAASIVVSLFMLVAIMGGLKWSSGIAAIVCVT